MGNFAEPSTPFGGFFNDEPAITGPHLLVSGPSGCGKSRRVLGPGILMWNGPVVAVSSKPDLIDMCLEKRLEFGGTGRTYVIDLSGEVPDRLLPEGVERVVIDPVALIRNDDDALDMATILMDSGTAGAGGGSNSGGGDPFWDNIAVAAFAALLRAAGKDGISWVLEAVGRIIPDEDDGDEHQPCWSVAIGRLAESSPMLMRKLAAAEARDAKMRDSISVTMESAVTPWLRSTVAGNGTLRAFTPDMLEHRRATLFMVAPATGVAAGAAVACVDFISKRWRANQTEEVTLPRLLLVVDELCNTMPWAKLPTVVTEARAMGINLLVAVQATSQFARRYGADGMQELRDVFPATLCLVGSSEKEMLEKAAWCHGQTERQKTSTDHRGQQSQSSEMVDTFAATDLLPKSMGEGRLLRGRAVGDTSEGLREVGLLVQLMDVSVILDMIRTEAA